MDQVAKCSVCGADITNGDTFCPNCGSPVQTMQEEVAMDNQTLESKVSEEVTMPTEPEQPQQFQFSQEQTQVVEEAQNNIAQPQQTVYGQTNFEQSQPYQSSTDTISQEPVKKGLGIASLLCGIFSLALCCVPGICQILAVVAIVCAIIFLKKKSKKGLAIFGIITAVIGLLLSIPATYIAFIAVGVMNGSTNKTIVKYHNEMSKAGTLPAEYFEDELTGTAWQTADNGVLYLYNDGTFILAQDKGVFSDNIMQGSYSLDQGEAAISKAGLEDEIEDEDFGLVRRTDIYYVKLTPDTLVSEGVDYTSVLSLLDTSDIETEYAFVLPLKEKDRDKVTLIDIVSGDDMKAKSVKLEKPTSGNEYDPANLQQPDSMGLDTEEPDDTTAASGDIDSDYDPYEGEIWPDASTLTDKITDPHQVYINGKVLTLPCKFSDLGVKLSEFSASDYEDFDTEGMDAGDRDFVKFDGMNGEVGIYWGYLENLSSGTIKNMNDLDITCIDADDYYDESTGDYYVSDIEIMGGIRIGSSLADVESVFGVDDSMYENTDMGYKSSIAHYDVDNVTFTIYLINDKVTEIDVTLY